MEMQKSWPIHNLPRFRQAFLMVPSSWQEEYRTRHLHAHDQDAWALAKKEKSAAYMTKKHAAEAKIAAALASDRKRSLSKANVP